MNERFSDIHSGVLRAKDEIGGIIAARARKEFVEADDNDDLPAKKEALMKRLISLCWQNPRKRNNQSYSLFFHEITNNFWAVSEKGE